MISPTFSKQLTSQKHVSGPTLLYVYPRGDAAGVDSVEPVEYEWISWSSNSITSGAPGVVARLEFELDVVEKAETEEVNDLMSENFILCGRRGATLDELSEM